MRYLYCISIHAKVLEEGGGGRGIRTLALHLNQTHSRVCGRTIMYTIAQISKPSCSTSAPDLLDARIRVRCGGSTGYRDPILSLGVLEGNVDFLGCLNILEFLRVVVGEEEEVGAGAFG
jgi:hypothetical protein